MARAARTKKQTQPARRRAASRPRRLAPREAAGSAERDQIRSLVALDATRLIARLAQRSDEMIALFSRHREREPLLAPLACWLSSADFTHLALLSAPQQAAVGLFLDELEALRWYVRYTDDMPSAVQLRLRSHRRRLEAALSVLLEAMGPALRAELPPLEPQ